MHDFLYGYTGHDLLKATNSCGPRPKESLSRLPDGCAPLLSPFLSAFAHLSVASRTQSRICSAPTSLSHLYFVPGPPSLAPAEEQRHPVCPVDALTASCYGPLTRRYNPGETSPDYASGRQPETAAEAYIGDLGEAPNALEGL